MTKINSSFFDSFTSGEEPEERVIPDVGKPDADDEDGADKDPVDDDDLDTNDPDTNTDPDDDLDKDPDPALEDTNFFTEIINDQAEKGRLFYDPEKEYEGSGEEIFDEVISDTLSKKWQEEYVEAIPEEYHSIFEHLRQGKSLTEWVDAVKPTDYSKIDLEDEANQKSLVEEHLALTGMDEEDIQDSIKEFEDAGTLDKNAKKALKYLQKNEDGKAKKYEAELEREREELEEVQAKEFDKFKSEVLTTEELGKRKLDKKKREELLDHITKPVNKKGESQFVINQKSRERQLLLALMDMEGFDFSKLEEQAKTKAASGLRAKLSKTTDLNAKKGGVGSRETVESKKISNWQPW